MNEPANEVATELATDSRGEPIDEEMAPVENFSKTQHNGYIDLQWWDQDFLAF